jgi:hypothetical protein
MGSARVSTYQKLSIHEKRAHDLRAVREPAITCPNCDTQVMPVDLLAHMDQRCAGVREPGPSAKWVGWREARALVPERTLVRWVDRGFVRFRGDRGERQYLYGDLAKRVSQLRGFRRR